MHRHVGFVYSDLLNLRLLPGQTVLQMFESANERGSAVGALSVMDA